MSLFLHCRQLCYRYPEQEQDLLKELSFSVGKGEFLGVLGAEDAGKTTFARLLKGLLQPSAGEIILGEPESARLSTKTPPQMLAAYRRAFGAVFSDPENQIVGASVEEDIAFGLGNLQIPSPEIRMRTDRYLSQLGLSHYAKRAPHELSGGEQQKLCVAGILVMEPECLILDEPLSFLDQKSRGELLQLFQTLNRQGKTVIYLSSDPDELLAAGRILLLREGRIVNECRMQRLWEEPELLEQIGIVPPDIMQFRHALERSGYKLRPDSLCPEALAEDICRKSYRDQT